MQNTLISSTATHISEPTSPHQSSPIEPFIPGSSSSPMPPPSLTSSEIQTLALSDIRMPFPALATLQELTLGTVTPIDEMLIEGMSLLSGSSSLVWKVKGVCIADSEDTNSHMIAINVLFSCGDYKDGLKMFGVVHQPVVSEFHMAVIGGTGKYVGANGYATIKAVTDGKKDSGIDNVKNFFLFTIYMS
ncbi:hypothetical protein Syun_001568 [Stephania yunnanensis]|uniref:Dirigent protein n=1 Tax=Stephania yunnanensis TaxID=152371 RepID=A0AAP0LF28_9MAGN